MKSASIIILSAGLGTRMRSSTPKVLHKISGLPMIFHIINEAQKISDDIHVVLFHQADLIKEKINKNFKNIHFHIQDLKNFPGTGGALKNLTFCHENALILCGDMPLVLAKDLQPLLQSKSDITACVFKARNPHGYGRVVLEDDRIIKIVEQKDASPDELKITTANAGVYLFKKDFLLSNLPHLSNDNAQKEYYITDLLSLANKQNLSVKAVFVEEENFMGVNSKVHLALAEEIMQKKIKLELMEQGVIMRLPESIFIDKRAKFIGECVIENGVCIEGECVIENSLIRANSIIEDSIVVNSSVGPMARIRPKSNIKNTHIGNFVETKNAQLNGVKAGHLSYLGDCEIDEGTNVGCGTITCNYDGKKKHKTIIGKNVFIGSDTQLIAPVKIKDNVVIAAGTTLTKDVPTNALAINREPLKIVANFYQKFFKRS